MLLSKNRCNKSSEGHTAHPVGYESPLQNIIAIFPNFILLDWVLQPAADYNDCLVCFKFLKKVPNSQYNLKWAATPAQITQQYSLQRAKGP